MTAPPTPAPAAGRGALDVRAEFPILAQRVNGARLVYLDNAATTQKPRSVIDAVRRFYEEDNAPVHRAVHTLGERATAAVEGARRVVARFLGAESPDEIVFLRGVTEAMNLLAFTLGESLGPGDEVVVPLSEHHSNLLPWREMCRRRGATLRLTPLAQDGSIDMPALESIVTGRTRIVSVAHVTNVMGVVNPVREVCALARRAGAVSVVDGAQAACHMPIDVQAIGCDFYAISGHKMYAPTGIGAVFGRRARWAQAPPWQTGGSTVERVSTDDVRYAEAPARFEAGSPNAAGIVGLAAAVRWLEGVGIDRIAERESAAAARAREGLASLPGVRVFGPSEGSAPVIAFDAAGAHPHDLATLLDGFGVAVRAGHHCAQPLADWLGVPATTRASFAAYNTVEDADALVEGVGRALETLR
ncbi:MAG: SufS family cysteine desulfurase [Planctomycetota bacterium]|nr:MAG: SufS family cysteine desulfurase [Planctomycetota bacterium]